MNDIKPSIVLEDSKGNRNLFYYRDFSIYYREISCNGDIKDTILISQANPDFAAVIDSDDAVYLVCNSRYKGVLLFSYTNLGWKFEPVVNINNSPNIYIMDILVQNDSVHIFFAKKLPVANMYNVYHLQKNLNEQNPYIEYSWKKNSLSEIYSQNIESSYSVIASKGGTINYAGVWYDGTYYYINYYCYDSSIKYWIHKSLNVSYKNQVSIKLLYQNKKISMLCFSRDNEAGNIRHFTSKASSSSDIDFKEASNAYIDTGGIAPIFYTDDKAIQLAWINDHIYHQYTLDDSSGKWHKAIDLQLTADANILELIYARNSGSVTSTRGYFIIDRNYNILKPFEHLSRHAPEEKPKEKTVAVTEVNDYLKQILDEVKGLSDSVKHLNSRMDDLENLSSARRDRTEKTDSSPYSKQIMNISEEAPKPLKKSNFKEKFMKNETTPSYGKLLISQENITTYVGKPSTTSVTSSEDMSEKRAFATPEKKNYSFLRKIGEFFK